MGRAAGKYKSGTVTEPRKIIDGEKILVHRTSNRFIRRGDRNDIHPGNETALPPPGTDEYGIAFMRSIGPLIDDIIIGLLLYTSQHNLYRFCSSDLDDF